MRLVRWWCACLLVGCVDLGCVDRTLGGGEEGSTAGTSSGDVTPTGGVDPSSPGTTVTTMPVTTAPGTTVTTEPVTTEPGTTVTATEPGTSTSTSGPSTTTSTTEPGSDSETETPVKLDVGDHPAEIPEGLKKGCTKTAPPGTAIKGMSALGPFFGTRAFFGSFDFGGTVGPLRLVILDDTADLDQAFVEIEQNFGEVTTGPAVVALPGMQWTVEDPFWTGTDEQAGLSVRVKGEGIFGTAKVSITGHAGNFDVADPNDPPRLQGTIEPGDDPLAFAGPFDAVFCDLLGQDQIIPE